MSQLQIKKKNDKEYYQKESLNQVNQLYNYNHFRIGENLDIYKNMKTILMLEALNNNYCKYEK